jgi:hypothetical protein
MQTWHVTIKPVYKIKLNDYWMNDNELKILNLFQRKN